MIRFGLEKYHKFNQLDEFRALQEVFNESSGYSKTLLSSANFSTQPRPPTATQSEQVSHDYSKCLSGGRKSSSLQASGRWKGLERKEGENHVTRLVKPQLLCREAFWCWMDHMNETRADVPLSACKLAEYCDWLISEHCNADKCDLRSNSRTRDGDIGSSWSCHLDKNVVSNTDWADGTKGRKSTNGYVFMIFCSANSWNFCKQNVVATFPCEA